MRRNLLAFLGALILAGPAAAQPHVDDCFGCVLGIWDEMELTTTSGSIAVNTLKDVYIGIKLDPAQRFNGLTGIEFSIAGFGQDLLVAGFDTIVPTTRVPEGPQAPADTSETSQATGGVHISWSTCLRGSQPLAKLTLLAFSEISDRVLRVMHAFPPASPAWRTPVFTQCDAPVFTATRVTGSFYCLNPGPHCPIDAVESSSWSSIKQLFR
jgi:hypothetical protein